MISQFDTAVVNPAALEVFQRFEELAGRGFTVNSAYRSPEHNAKVGGAKHSQHINGNAFDISTTGLGQDQVLGLIENAREAGFRGIGVYPNALHFDIGPSRAWGPDHTRGSLPGWASAAVGFPAGEPVPTSEPPKNGLSDMGRLNLLTAMRPQYRNSLAQGFLMT